MLERLICNQVDGGWNPSSGSNLKGGAQLVKAPIARTHERDAESRPTLRRFGYWHEGKPCIGSVL